MTSGLFQTASPDLSAGRGDTTRQAGEDILLIEDHHADILLFREALKGCAPSCQVSVLRDGSVLARDQRPDD
jgi:hypothetical protein